MTTSSTEEADDYVKKNEFDNKELNKTATDVQRSSTLVDKVRSNNPPLDNEL